MNQPTRECALVAPMLTAREGELSPEERGLIDLHLAACVGCRGLAADLAATDGMVGEALLAAAARRDFAPFVDAVMDRTGLVEPASVVERALRWMRAHRAATVAGALAPTLAAAALIVYLSAFGAPAPRSGEVEVVAEGRAPMVLQTSEGPVVLLGEPDGT